jgi:hypothetical protein
MDQPVPMRRPLLALAEVATARLELAVMDKVHITGRKKYQRSPINGFIIFIRKFLGQK